MFFFLCLVAFVQECHSTAQTVSILFAINFLGVLITI